MKVSVSRLYVQNLYIDRLSSNIKPIPEIFFNVHVHPTLIFKGVRQMIITNEEKVVVKIEPKTPAGNIAKIDGVPTWIVEDPAVAAVNILNAEGTEVEILSVGLGQTMVRVEFDADLDVDETRMFVGAVDVTVVEPEAIDFSLSTSTPTLK